MGIRYSHRLILYPCVIHLTCDGLNCVEYGHQVQSQVILYPCVIHLTCGGLHCVEYGHQVQSQANTVSLCDTPDV